MKASWTGEQDDRSTAAVHSDDERRSHERSVAQIPPPEPDEEG